MATNAKQYTDLSKVDSMEDSDLIAIAREGEQELVTTPAINVAQRAAEIVSSDQVQEVIADLGLGKQVLVQSLNNKGAQVQTSDTFEQISAKIDNFDVVGAQEYIIPNAVFTKGAGVGFSLNNCMVYNAVEHEAYVIYDAVNNTARVSTFNNGAEQILFSQQFEVPEGKTFTDMQGIVMTSDESVLGVVIKESTGSYNYYAGVFDIDWVEKTISQVGNFVAFTGRNNQRVSNGIGIVSSTKELVCLVTGNYQYGSVINTVSGTSTNIVYTVNGASSTYIQANFYIDNDGTGLCYYSGGTNSYNRSIGYIVNYNTATYELIFDAITYQNNNTRKRKILSIPSIGIGIHIHYDDYTYLGSNCNININLYDKTGILNTYELTCVPTLRYMSSNLDIALDPYYSNSVTSGLVYKQNNIYNIIVLGSIKCTYNAQDKTLNFGDYSCTYNGRKISATKIYATSTSEYIGFVIYDRTLKTYYARQGSSTPAESCLDSSSTTGNCNSYSVVSEPMVTGLIYKRNSQELLMRAVYNQNKYDAGAYDIENKVAVLNIQ